MSPAPSSKYLTSGGSVAPLESVLCTEVLLQRQSRPPDYECESRALEELVETLADSPEHVLQRLAETLMELCPAGSAGVSLLDQQSGQFRWPAIAGAWAPHVGSGMPQKASPCGVVLEQNAVQLFCRPERCYEYRVPIAFPIVEALLAPFHCEGRPVGTVWVFSHDENRKFDAEDKRLLQSLSRFASAAFRKHLAARDEAPEVDWLRGGGEMGKLVRSQDWSQTPLGPIETWPQSLRTTVSLALASNFPISIAWGPKRVQIYNDGYWPICGAKHPRSMGQDFKQCWFSAWPAIGEAFESAVGGNTAFLENQWMFLDRHGYLEETFFTFSFSPIRDESGEVAGLFHPVTEMTQQSLSERRLKILKDLADCTADAKTVESASALVVETLSACALDLPFALLYLLDEDGKRATLAGGAGVEQGASACPLIVDLTARDERTWPLADAASTRQIVQVDELAQRVELSSCGPYPEPPQTAFVLPINISGREHPFALLVAGVSARRALDGPYRTFYLLLREAVTNALTNARSYEEERRRAEALAALDRAKTAFFSNVSHEFRTPLTLLLGPLEDCLAKNESLLSAEVREDLGVAHRNALRLLKLVNTLLDFSRIEAGRIQASYEPTDLAALTTELASVFRSAVERAGLQLIVSCEPLPEPVYVDREMWEKIVLNLLSNAFKFTFEGRIEVQLEAVEQQVQLSVRDTGVGIPDQELPRVFDRFHRVKDSRGRTHEGTGIGLALVQELVKLHGGSVRVESDLGRGSSFTLCLPFGFKHLPADRIGAASSLASTALRGDAFVEEALRWLSVDEEAAPTTRDEAVQPPGFDFAEFDTDVRPRILWADDNADMREYVTRLLGQRFEVEAVPDGQAALEAVRARRPDLVLSDVMMPRLDGFGLLRELRAVPATMEIPVILLSARAGEESRIEGLRFGADDYLIKPFSARELLARVEAHVRMARLREESKRIIAESEERYALVVAGAEAAIWDWDILAKSVRFSPRWKELRGLCDHEVSDSEEDWMRGIHPEDFDRVMATLRAHFEGQTAVFAEEYRVRHKDGNWVWILNRGLARRADSGRVIRMAGSETDITERKQTEVALRESEERFRAFLMATSEVVYRMNPDWTEMRYLQGREFIADTLKASRTWLDKYIHPDDQRHVMETIQQAILTKQIFELEHRVIRVDGTLGWTHSRAIPILDERGQIVEWFGAASDTTHRKQVEESLRSTNEELSRFNCAAVGRELRMIELKKEVNALCRRLGVSERYSLEFEQVEP